MRWKILNKFFLLAVLICIIIGIVGYLFLFSSEAKKKSAPVFLFPYSDIQWIADFNATAELQLNSLSPRKKSTSKKLNDKHIRIRYPLQISTCLPDKKAPDYVAKQLRRATGHEDDPCAKIKLDMNF